MRHLGARAIGDAGIVFTEAAHVSPVARITLNCLGPITEPEHAEEIVANGRATLS
jgi:2,4-dienoyl-CoA reductase-like NADH-dependent reductase (Old Yellow Enzyme family)